MKPTSHEQRRTQADNGRRYPSLLMLRRPSRYDSEAAQSLLKTGLALSVVDGRFCDHPTKRACERAMHSTRVSHPGNAEWPYAGLLPIVDIVSFRRKPVLASNTHTRNQFPD